MLTYNTVVVMLGAGLLGAQCGAIGSYAVLRRRALLGDVLAHAALPGIALAFWFTGLKQAPVLLAGALATGLVGIWFLVAARRRLRTKADAAMGLVLSVFFGAGVALSRWVQNTVQDGSQAGLDTYLLGKTAGILLADVVLVAVLSVLVLLALVAFSKEFKLVSFDPEFAQSIGWRSSWIDLSLMALLAASVVVGLPMVGVVMVAALTILPAVAARFWTDRLSAMLWLAAGFGGLSAVAGVWVSAADSGLPTGPVIILVCGVAFVISSLVAPNRGLVARWVRARAMRLEHGARVVVQETRRAPLREGLVVRDLQSAGVPNPITSLRLAEERGWVVRRDEWWHAVDPGEAQP